VVDTPVTVAVVPAPAIVATDVDVLLQVPPGVASKRVVVPPEQTMGTPVMLEGMALTVMGTPVAPQEVV